MICKISRTYFYHFRQALKKTKPRDRYDKTNMNEIGRNIYQAYRVIFYFLVAL